VGTGFRHQKDFIAAALQTFAHPDFGFSTPILPAVVIKRDSAIDRLMDDFDRGLCIRGVAEVMAAEAKHRNFGVGAAGFS